MGLVNKSLIALVAMGSFLSAGGEYYVCYQTSSLVPITDKESFVSYDGCKIVNTDCSCLGERQYGEYRSGKLAKLGLKQCMKLKKKF